MQAVVLFRHPGAFVESLLRLGWPFGGLIEQFLSNDALMEDWLGPFAALMETMRRREDVEAAATLHGCLCVVLEGFCERNEAMIAVRHEDLCASPLEQFRALYAALHIPYSDAVRETHVTHSFGNEQSEGYQTHAVRRNSSAMAQRWRHRVDAQTMRRIRQIWDSFDLPRYRADKDW